MVVSKRTKLARAGRFRGSMPRNRPTLAASPAYFSRSSFVLRPRSS
jgi:hypothetical protein